MRKVMVNAAVKMSFVALSSFTLLAASPSAVAASTQLATDDGPGVQQQIPAQSGSGAPIQHIPGNAGTGDAATASKGSKSKGTKKDTKDTTGDGTGTKTKGSTGTKTTGASTGTKDTTGDGTGGKTNGSTGTGTTGGTKDTTGDGTGNATAGGSLNTGGKDTGDTTGDGTGNATAGGSLNTGGKDTGDTTGDGTGNATGGATGPNTAGKDTGDTTGDGTGNATGGASQNTAGEDDDDAVGTTGNDQGVTTVNVQTNSNGTVVAHTETTTFANGSRVIRVFNNGVLVREVTVPAGAAVPNGVGNTGTTPTTVAGQQAAPSLAMLPATSTAPGAPAGILGASIALAGAWLLRRGRKA